MTRPARSTACARTGGLDHLLNNVPSPNGLVLNMKENRLFLAVTRQNAVWRCPIMTDGTMSKVGTYIQLSGGHGGPDGMALDEEDAIIVCQLGVGVWRFDSDGMATHLITGRVGHHLTNVAYGGPGNRTLFINGGRYRHDPQRRHAGAGQTHVFARGRVDATPDTPGE